MLCMNDVHDCFRLYDKVRKLTPDMIEKATEKVFDLLE